MTLIIPRKRMLTAHGKRVVFVKGSNESAEHVLMKAFIWALYLPEYPELTVEIKIGDRYKPDVVMLNADGTPRFWGESGQVSVQKIRSLVRRFRDTHFVIAKWNTSLASPTGIVREALAPIEWGAPFDLLRFPADAAERFINADGHVNVTHADIEWMRL